MLSFRDPTNQIITDRSKNPIFLLFLSNRDGDKFLRENFSPFSFPFLRIELEKKTDESRDRDRWIPMEGMVETRIRVERSRTLEKRRVGVRGEGDE